MFLDFFDLVFFFSRFLGIYGNWEAFLTSHMLKIRGCLAKPWEGGVLDSICRGFFYGLRVTSELWEKKLAFGRSTCKLSAYLCPGGHDTSQFEGI